jgi:hypothetical protein
VAWRLRHPANLKLLPNDFGFKLRPTMPTWSGSRKASAPDLRSPPRQLQTLVRRPSPAIIGR